MDNFFIDTLGFSENAFAYGVLPILIFLARVCEVSTNTIRIIYMLGGRRMTATIMGFVEAFIWLVAMRQIFQHLDNWACYIAYPGGFAGGILVGMIIEERIAYGNVIVRIITKDSVSNLILFLQDEGFRYTKIDAHGQEGDENLVFTVLNRDKLNRLTEVLEHMLPSAFYTMESVKTPEEDSDFQTTYKGGKLFTWLRGIIRY